jgi:Putative DNA-binding domain
MNLQMSDADLLARLRNFEDHFVERKTVSDSKDWLKTVVAFANSAPFGLPCILYIGVRDDGRFEDTQSNFDSVQKTLNRILQNIYPRAAYFPKLITDGTAHALAVIVPGSELRPHFSGPSYIRVGSETMEASKAQLDTLVAMRINKVYRLTQSIGKQVTVINLSLLGNGTFMRGNWGTVPVILDCNEFWVTLQSPGAKPQSFALRDVELNFDNQRDRLQLEITTREL